MQGRPNCSKPEKDPAITGFGLGTQISRKFAESPLFSIILASIVPYAVIGMLKFANSARAGNHLNSMKKTLILSVWCWGDKQVDTGCHQKIESKSGEDTVLTSIFTDFCQQIDDEQGQAGRKKRVEICVVCSALFTAGTDLQSPMEYPETDGPRLLFSN
jgi:hypothetical protein